MVSIDGCPYCERRGIVYDGNCERCRARRLARCPRPMIAEEVAEIRRKHGAEVVESFKKLLKEEHDRDAKNR